MTASWRVSPILVPLIAEEKTQHPFMVVGTIGDQAHQDETQSDHEPDQWSFVAAGDFMIGTAKNPSTFTASEAEYLFDRITAMIRGGDKRCAYAIYNRRIVSSTVKPGIVRTYGGTNPHTDHVHVSVPHGSQPHPTTSWGIYQGDDMTPTEGRTAAKLGVYDALEESSSGDTPTGRQMRTFINTLIDNRLAGINTKLDTLIAQTDTTPAVLKDNG